LIGDEGSEAVFDAPEPGGDITQTAEQGHCLFSLQGIGPGREHGERAPKVLDFVVAIELQHYLIVANICSPASRT